MAANPAKPHFPQSAVASTQSESQPQDGGLDELLRTLSAARASRADRDAWLRRMTPEARVAAMWRGELNFFDFRYWQKIAAAEIPLIGGEYAWVAMLDPEWCE